MTVVGTGSRPVTRLRKLVCIDIQPYGTSQAAERDDVLDISGFSDAVFDQIADLPQESHGS